MPHNILKNKPGVPEFWANPREHARKTAQIVNQLQNGQGNNSYKINLEDNATSTEIMWNHAREGMVVLFAAQDAVTAAEISNGTLYAVVTNGKITINHASSVGDKFLAVAILG